MAKAGDAADSVLESLGAAATTKPQKPLHSRQGRHSARDAQAG